MLRYEPISIENNLDWDALVQSSSTATFFQERQWMQIWLKHFPVEYEIVGVYDGSLLIGIAPLSFNQGKVCLLGTTPVLGKEQVCDFGDIICSPQRETDIWKNVLKYLSENHAGKIFFPRFIKEDSPSFILLKSIAKDYTLETTSPYLKLPESWDEYVNGLDRKDRHELRRKLRKLESASYRVYQADPTPDNQEQFISLMKQSTPEKETFLSQPMKDFFFDFLTHLNKEQIILWFMDIEGKPVAGALAFRFKDELLLYNSGMNLAYKHLSVGLLSKALLIQYCIKLGLKKFDFLQGNEPYKYNLGGIDNKLYQFTIPL